MERRGSDMNIPKPHGQDTNARPEQLSSEPMGRFQRAARGHIGAAIRMYARHRGSSSADFIADQYANEEHLPNLLTTWNGSVDDLYERLAFAERHPGVEAESYSQQLLHEAAKTLELPPNATWNDLVPRAFPKKDARPILSLIKRVGFIPHDLINAPAFAVLPPWTITNAIHTLRTQIDNRESINESFFLRVERARLLNAFIERGLLTRAKKKNEHVLSVDTRGVWITLSDPTLNAHIPFGLIQDGTIETYKKQSLLSPAEQQEVAVRRASANEDPVAYRDTTTEQLCAFAKQYGITKQEPADIQNALQLEMDRDPSRFGRWLVEHREIIPDILIHSLAESHHERRNVENLFTALSIGEAVQTHVAGESLRREPELFSSYKLMNARQETYEARSRILHDPRTYNTQKILYAFLDGPLPRTGSDNESALFRGEYRSSERTGTHAFLELSREGRTARILYDESALPERLAKEIEVLPSLDRETHGSYEAALRAFEYFHRTAEDLQTVFDRKRPRWEQQFREMAETCIHYVRSNITRHAREAEHLLATLLPTLKTASADDLAPLFALMRSAEQEYRPFLYQAIAKRAPLHEMFAPELKIETVSYGRAFEKEAERMCAADGYDPNLCLNAPPVRAVSVSYQPDDPTGAIPYHIELSCLDAIRLDRKRPLINVIGGAREAGVEARHSHTHPLNEMALGILRVAHEAKANVAIPGTQSGLGTAFGIQATHYARQFGSLPHAERAHLFSVTPGKNIFFPGHTDLTTKQSEVFALTPVDAILTPFEAEWEHRGNAREQSAYLNHIAFMESLYARASAGQERIMVAGNGGYYAILEIIESLKHAFKLVLIEDSGRSAGALAAAFQEVAQRINELDDEAIDRATLAACRARMTHDAAEEFFKKDFGSEKTQTEDHLVYRDLFRKLLRQATAHPERITITTFNQLEDALREMCVSA